MKILDSPPTILVSYATFEDELRYQLFTSYYRFHLEYYRYNYCSGPDVTGDIYS